MNNQLRIKNQRGNPFWTSAGLEQPGANAPLKNIGKNKSLKHEDKKARLPGSNF
jgi:hypothetical protein